jgi:hypothetical protein
MAFDDDAICGCLTQNFSHFPECSRPDFAVVVFVAGFIKVIERFLAVHSAQTRGVCVVFQTYQKTIPAHHRVAILRRFPRFEEACRPIITEALAHRGSFCRLPEIGTNRILNCVSEFVDDRFPIFGIVDVAGPVGQQSVPRAEPGVVLSSAIDLDAYGFGKDCARPAIAKAFQITD